MNKHPSFKTETAENVKNFVRAIPAAALDLFILGDVLESTCDEYNLPPDSDSKRRNDQPGLSSHRFTLLTNTNKQAALDNQKLGKELKLQAMEKYKKLLAAYSSQQKEYEEFERTRKDAKQKTKADKIMCYCKAPKEISEAKSVLALQVKCSNKGKCPNGTIFHLTCLPVHDAEHTAELGGISAIQIGPMPWTCTDCRIVPPSVVAKPVKPTNVDDAVSVEGQFNDVLKYIVTTAIEKVS